MPRPYEKAEALMNMIKNEDSLRDSTSIKVVDTLIIRDGKTKEVLLVKRGTND